MPESEKKYGIEDLKKGLELPIAIHMAVDKSLADGKIDLADAGNLVGPVMAIPGFIKSLKNMPKQFAELDEAEKGELKQWAQDKYDIADDKVERIVEKSFKVLVDVGDLVHDSITGDDA